MRYYVTIALLTGMVIGMSGQVVAGDRLLDSYRWRNRVLFIGAVSPDDGRAVALKRSLEDRRREVLERDLVVVRVYENGTGSRNGVPLSPDEVRQVRGGFSIGMGACVVVLVGKDGTEKLREPCAVDLEDIFAVIDAMPMRQQEMRQRGVEGR